MEKSTQKYFVLVKTNPAEAGGMYKAIMDWKEKPMEWEGKTMDVTLEEAFQVFGEWDFAILFRADTNDTALHFVGDMLRHVEGVVETFTMPLSTMRNYRSS